MTSHLTNTAPRSLLYLPASRPERFPKIFELHADHYVLDLEDGVAPGDKAKAREALTEWFESLKAPPANVWIRVQSIHDPSFEIDLSLVEALSPYGVILAKAEQEEALQLMRERLPRSVLLGAMIETPLGVERVGGLAKHCSMLVLGSADLKLELGASDRAGREFERRAIEKMLYAARSYGASAIDSVWFHFKDLDGLLEHGRYTRNLGFDGKSCIHPCQIDPIHELWRPSTKEIEWAEKILEGWRTEGGDQKGIVVIEGEMIEALHLRRARQILANANRSTK